MEALSDSELDERWKIVFATETGPELPREEVIEAIMANSPTPKAAGLPVEETKEEGKWAKGKNGNDYFIPASAKGKVVVRQVQLGVDNGGVYEVPNTETIQTYSKASYERLKRQNFFEESKIRVEELQGA